ncbi:MAG: DUF1573 domain-containing protein [Planctomycetaceae bacterium]
MLFPKSVGPLSFPFIAQVAAIAVVMLSSVFCYGTWRTGSINLVWPWLMGRELLFSPMSIELGDVSETPVVETKIRVINVSAKRLSVLGSQRSCVCIGLDEFPVEIAPGETRDLRIKIGTAKTAGRFEHHIRFFVNDGRYTEVEVKIIGDVQ